ncbi:MAG: DUF1499 domain-containing protein [Pseudomonadota bacterium]
MVRRMLVWGLFVVLVLGAAFAAYVRLAPSDPATWQVDPITVVPPTSPNYALVRPGEGDDPVFAATPDALLSALNQIALAAPRVTPLAGSVDSGEITFVARSALWGFPDYISVKAVPAGDGAQLAIFSRSRFGHSDMGVNAARITSWMDALKAEIPTE